MNPDEMYYLNGPDEFVNPNESTSAPVEKEEQIHPPLFVDGDFSDSYEARVKRATGKNMIVSKEEYKSLQEENARLRSLIETVFKMYAPVIGQGEWEQFKKDNNL
jgi:hypothetical protein